MLSIAGWFAMYECKRLTKAIGADVEGMAPAMVKERLEGGPVQGETAAASLVKAGHLSAG